MNEIIMFSTKYYMRFIFLFCSFYVFPSAYCQHHICLQDMNSGKPVQYANIFTGNVVYYTNKDGHLNIPDSCTSVRISHICYTDTLIILSENKNTTVQMRPKIYEIPEIVVGGNTNNRQQLVGPMGKNGRLFYGGKSGSYVGVFIPYEKDYDSKVIYSIVTDLHNIKKTLSGSYVDIKNAILRFDLRLPDSQNNAPSSTSVIGGGIVFEDTSNGRKIIPLNHPVSFPHSGLFVIIEWIVKGECKGDVIYNPHIRMSKSSQPSVSWLKREYKKENWVSWNVDEGMKQFQESVTARFINANLGILLSE